MKNKLPIFFLIGLIITAFVGLQVTSEREANIQVQEKSDNDTPYQPRVDERGEVVIEAMPKRLTTGSDSVFEIELSTHSVDLNFNLEEIAYLTDDRGDIYNPLSWSGGKGCHHLSGALIFPKVNKSAKKVILTISGIEGEDRVFEWEI